MKKSKLIICEGQSDLVDLKSLKSIKKSIIVIQDNEPFVGTWDLSQGFEVEHRTLTNLIKKYRSEFLDLGKEVGIDAFKMRQIRTEKRGKPFEEYLLCEEQAIYVTMLLQNNDQVRKFKVKLSKEFMRQRRAIAKLIGALQANQKNAEWLEKRASGKIERRIETDSIKEFVEYAKTQGSERASKYYMAITKMENSALFHLELLKCEYKNLRDIVNGFALDALKMADRIVAKALKEGMERSMYYKSVFQLAKERVESFAGSLGKIHIESITTRMIS